MLTESGWDRTDVLIEDGHIVAMGEGLGTGHVVDASDCLVGPGFVDLHTHLREPGQTWKEDIASGSAAAAAGGYTAVVAMPNTEPPTDSATAAAQVARIGREVGVTEVLPAGTLTVGRSGAIPAPVDELYEAGVRMFTDDGDSVADVDVLRNVMGAVASLPGAVVAQHAEDIRLTVHGHMHEGSVSRRLGIRGLPAAAEVDVVRRDLGLVAETGVAYHCQHISSRLTLEEIGAAKARGLAVSAEVTPHHLTFDHTDLEDLGTDFKMYPPLRGPEDRMALIAALKDGTIDVVGTDHAPHTVEEKAVPFTAAPRGVIGLETAAAAVWEALEDRERLFEVMSRAPARLLGLQDQGRPLAVGSAANIVVFDPGARWVATSFASKSANSPYLGRMMTGAVTATLHRGRLVHEIGARTI